MEALDYYRFVLALLFVLGLIGLLAWLARRFRFDGSMLATTGRRLAVSEMLSIDARRKLVLVRRDGTEHLLVIGQDGTQLLESGIVPPPNPAPSPTFSPTPTPPPTPRANDDV